MIRDPAEPASGDVSQAMARQGSFPRTTQHRTLEIKMANGATTTCCDRLICTCAPENLMQIVREEQFELDAEVEGSAAQLPHLDRIADCARRAAEMIRDSLPKWVCGWNMPGCLPESDPAEFAKWEDAHGYILGTVEQFWNEDEDADMDTPKWVDLHTQLHHTIMGKPYSYIASDGSLVFWLSPKEQI